VAESIPSFLGGLGWTYIDRTLNPFREQYGHWWLSSDYEEAGSRTLWQYLRQNWWAHPLGFRAQTAGWVATILSHAGVVEVEHGNSSRIRLLPPYAPSVSADTVVQRVAEVFDALEQSMEPYGQASIPASPGIFAVFLWFVNQRGHSAPHATSVALGLSVQSGGLLYVGHATSNLEAAIRSEFEAATSERSDLRRSLGAVLHSQLRYGYAPSLDLTPVPANQERPGDAAWMFDATGESRLSEWMRANLAVATFEHASDDVALIALESRLRAFASPFLRHPLIGDALDKCRDIAAGGGQI
jgi:hypothetical protein